MQRKQNTRHRGCPCEDRREAEGNRGALSTPSRRDEAVCGESGLLDRVLDKRNLYNAYKQVFANKGAAGIDGMTVNDLMQPARLLIEATWPIEYVVQNYFQPYGGAALPVVHEGRAVGVLTAEARELSCNPRLGTYTAEVRDEKGDLVAVFQGLAYRKKDSLAMP